MSSKLEVQLAMLRELKSLNAKLDVLPLPLIADTLAQLSQDVETLKGHVLNGSTNVKLDENYKTLADLMLQERNNRLIAEEAYRFKKINRKEWTSILNSYKMANFYAIKFAETAEIYQHYFGKEVQFIPKKFKTANTSMDEARAKMEEEIETLERKATFKLSAKEESIRQITLLIQTSGLSLVGRQKLTEIWNEEKTTEEKTSRMIWQKKKDLLLNLEEIEKKQAEATPQGSSGNQNRGGQGRKNNQPQNRRGNNTQNVQDDRQNDHQPQENQDPPQSRGSEQRKSYAGAVRYGRTCSDAETIIEGLRDLLQNTQGRTPNNPPQQRNGYNNNQQHQNGGRRYIPPHKRNTGPRYQGRNQGPRYNGGSNSRRFNNGRGQGYQGSRYNNNQPFL